MERKRLQRGGGTGRGLEDCRKASIGVWGSAELWGHDSTYKTIGHYSTSAREQVTCTAAYTHLSDHSKSLRWTGETTRKF